jgi:hypothetical protein
MLLLSCLAFESAVVGYYVGQNSVEAVEIPVYVDVEVPEKFEKSMYLALYEDGRMEECPAEGPADKTGLLYVVQIEYTPDGDYGWQEVSILLDFGDGYRVVGLRIPCGKFKVSHSQVNKPTAKPEGEGF